MTDAERLVDLQGQLDHVHLRLAVALDSEALALAALSVARQQVALPPMFTDDMDAANEPDVDPDAHLPVMPAQALRRQHAVVGLPGGPWGGPWVALGRRP